MGARRACSFSPNQIILMFLFKIMRKKKKYCPPGTLPAFSVIHTPLVTLRYPYPFQPHQEALPPCLPCSTPIFYIYPDTQKTVICALCPSGDALCSHFPARHSKHLLGPPLLL